MCRGGVLGVLGSALLTKKAILKLPWVSPPGFTSFHIAPIPGRLGTLGNRTWLPFKTLSPGTVTREKATLVAGDVTQLIGCFWSHMRPWVPNLAQNKLNVVAQACNPIIREGEAPRDPALERKSNIDSH